MTPAPDAVSPAAPAGLKPPRGARSPGAVAGFLLVALQLGLVLAVVRLFEVAERNHFLAVACLAAGGFVVHYWLPPRFRAAFFGLLSLGGILFVLGWPDGLRVIGIGAGLIALCHLPVPFALRVAAVALAGLFLALLRVELDRPFWAVLGSMFMFRLAVYLYDLRRAARPPLALTAAYFFPLPNVSFLFFPILDFKTFRDTYRPDAPWTVAQEGVGWIVRGLAHLLLYRVVKYYLLPAPHEVADVPTLALFLATGYALYLRVSGYFHLITGVFHLFGFHLPRTHHNYFLAASFTDVWRRINIYWKDFMTKLFFLPAFFALRGRGTRAAAVAATLWVFLATWLLHAYQVFWLTGALPLSGYDAGLWLVVGVLVAWNLRHDLAHAARPAADRAPPGPRAVVGRWLRVVGMFALVSFFWACWNTPSFLTHLRALPVTGTQAAVGAAQVLGVLLAVAAVGAAVQLAGGRLTRKGVLPPCVSPAGSAVGCAAALTVAVLCGIPEVTAVFGPRAAGVVESLRRESVTPAEAAQVAQGYYEEVTAARVPAGAWLAALEGRPRPPDHTVYTDMTRPADDLLELELIPNWGGVVGGSRVSINQFGMRDRPGRSRVKPPGTARIAVVGSSVVMGYGVGDQETFCHLLEDRLNAGGGPRYEVLNFGAGRSYAIHRRALIDRTVFAFEPDALYYVAHQDELRGPDDHLARLVRRGTPLPYPYLADVVRKAGVTPDMSEGLTVALIRPHVVEIVSGVYRDVVAECRRRGVRPVWVYLPMPGVEDGGRVGEFAADLARAAGFEVVDLSGWVAGRRPGELRVHEANAHPNALGHRLIADRLEEELRRRPALLSRAAGPGR